MQDAVTLADRAIALNPVEFPGIYYYAAVANYDLKHLDVAEKEARQAVDLDKSHDYPAGEKVLGEVLADNGQAHDALAHLNKYVKLAPKADDIPAVQQKMPASNAASPKRNIDEKPGIRARRAIFRSLS